jgi:hypothetical protein
MQIVYLADNSINAQALVMRLADEGIEAFVDGVHHQSAFGSMPIVGNVRIVCADEDAQRARELLLTWDKEGLEQRSGSTKELGVASELGITQELGDDEEQHAEAEDSDSVEQLYGKVKSTSRAWIWIALALLLLAVLFGNLYK